MKHSFVTNKRKKSGVELSLGSISHSSFSLGAFPRPTGGRNNLAMNHGIGFASVVEVDVMLKAA